MNLTEHLTEHLTASEAVKVASPVERAISDQREALISLRKIVETLSNRLEPISLVTGDSGTGGEVGQVNGRSPLLCSIESSTEQVKRCSDILVGLIGNLQI